jgi:hypothetical protein
VSIERTTSTREIKTNPNIKTVESFTKNISQAKSRKKRAGHFRKEQFGLQNIEKNFGIVRKKEES